LERTKGEDFKGKVLLGKCDPKWKTKIMTHLTLEGSPNSKRIHLFSFYSTCSVPNVPLK
jgi:hypothetical protein